jgi:hypothetical protein
VEKSIAGDEATEKVVRMVEFCLSFADSGLVFSESARRWGHTSPSYWMACFVLRDWRSVDLRRPIVSDNFMEDTAVWEIHHVKPNTHSRDRSAGCLSVACCLVSATVPCCTTRVPFAAAGPTTFVMTKGGGTSRTTCRFAFQNLAQLLVRWAAQR